MSEDKGAPEARVESLAHIVDVLADRMHDPRRFVDLPPDAKPKEVNEKYAEMEAMVTNFERRVPQGGVRHRFAQELHGIVETLRTDANANTVVRNARRGVWDEVANKNPQTREKNPAPTVALLGTLILLNPYQLAGTETFAPGRHVQPKFEQVKMKIERTKVDDPMGVEARFSEAAWSYMSELGELTQLQDVLVTAQDKARVLEERNPLERAKIYNKVTAQAERKVNPMSRREMAA